MTYKLDEWDLSELKQALGSKSIQDACKKIAKKVESFEKHKKLLTDDIPPKTFLKLVDELENIKIITATLGCMTGLKVEEDSSNQQAQADQTFVETSLTKFGNKMIFFSHWFKQLPEKKAQELIKECGENKYYFEQVWKDRKYMLKENEEKIINLKDSTGVSALNSVYDILTSQFKYDIDGKEYTQQEVIVMVRDPDPQVREKAYITLLSKYKHYKDALGEIYKNILNDWREESIHLRGYKNSINVRNVSNDLPDKAVEALLSVCEKNQGLFQRFFELKRKKMGLKQMRRFDLYAPVKKTKENIPYDQAVNMVLNTFEGFHPLFKKYASTIIDTKHVHSKLQKNKHTGAFCCSVTSKRAPYVLINYTGTSRDVSTLAHELGHGIHHMLASKHSEFSFHSCLPLAETASVFGEMLLSEKLMEENPKQAKELLFGKLDEIYATIIRQAGFVRFEQKAHEMMKEGKTIEDLGKVYLRDLRKQLGNKIEVDDLFAYEWCYIPHIYHSPFYCYAYAFGNLLVLALWEMYKEQGKPFAEKIVNMLALGGSVSPQDITKTVGVDICSETFWQKGFEVLEGMMKKVE
jgi:oligoendopeptidase F